MIRNRLYRFASAVIGAATLTILSAAPAAAQTEIVLHAKNASRVLGDWQLVSDTTAAGGARMWNPDRGAAKVTSPLANPYDYFELTFNAEAGRAYRLWLRGNGEHQSWSNDSVHVQFNSSLYASGGAAYRIGTTDATSVNIEDCGGCGISGWGWQDNGYDGLGTLVYFATTGPQTVRIQRREDGISIDQVVLSASRYLTTAPGSLKSDSTLLAETTGTATTTIAPSTSTSTSSTSTAAEVVIPVAAAATVRGNFRIAGDSSAAGGGKAWLPDSGASKLSNALASPTDYFEVSFNAEAGRAYRLWIRGKADSDSWANDSVFVQFNGSLNSAGSAAYRIGTTSSTVVSIEQGSGWGLSKWGWSDNGWDSMGDLVYFATTGPQTLRVQRREDGVSIDQIVLSSSTYLTKAPGAAKDDSTVLTSGTSTTTEPAPTTAPAPAPSTTSGADVVIPVAATATVRGNWKIVADSTAAGGGRVANADWGAGKLSTAAAAPSDYFDVTFNAEAGRGYRLWIRGKAQNDHWANDSVFVQFSGSVTSGGSATFRMGTTSATIVSLEQGNGYGLSGWGWSDNGWDSLGDLIYFATTGTQTLRVQRREDGLSIDQIVLSPSTYLSSAPGAAKNDTTLLTGSSGSTTTEPAPAPAPEPEPEPAPAPSTSGVKLRVMMWNVHHGVGSDGSYNIDRQATWMAKMNPDVVVLNEVEKYTSWGNEDQPERFRSMLQAKTGRTWYKHFAQEYGQWWSNGKGHLILSTYPFNGVSQTTITQSSGLNGAGAASQATIYVNGRAVNFILSHLDPYDRDMRLVQAKDVIRWAAGFAENRILAGDMNAWPDQTSILEINKTYYDSWTVATNNGTATGISGISPFGATKNGRIDYIFFSKNAPNLVVLDSKTPDTRDGNGVMPSDHRPVVTTFEVR